MTEQQNYQNDEIDLFDLFDDIKAQWHWVIGTSALVVIVGLLYALLATPQFKAESTLVAVSHQSLVPINLAKRQIHAAVYGLGYYEGQHRRQGGDDRDRDTNLADPLEAEELLNNLSGLLNSRDNKIAFYNALVKDKELSIILNHSKKDYDSNIDVFLKRFSSKLEKVKNSDRLLFEITFNFEDAKLAAEILNQYVGFVVHQHLSIYRNAFEYELASTIDSIVNLKQSALTRYEFGKNYRIASLEEAIAIAERIGQKKPFYTQNQVVSDGTPPLYMMGELALQEELAQLKARGSNEKKEDMYIEGFSILNEKHSLLEKISVDWNNITLVRIDARATTPRAPFKPKKALVVAMAGMAGLMLGVMLALLVAAAKRRNQANEDKKKAEKV